MKQTATFTILLALLVLSCNKNKHSTQTPDDLGTWRLTAIYLDPGDGSGSYQSVSSQKKLKFDAGLVLSNGQICDMSTDASSSSSANYQLSDSTIIGCSQYMLGDLRFSITVDTLLVYYPCIEACIAKYIRQY